MNWEAIGAGAEALGAFGVIITLLYLSFQIRQNTKVARGATRQAISDATVDLASEFSGDTGLGELLIRSLEGQSLTKPEALRLHARGFREMKHFENIYYQLRQGLMPEAEWSGYRQNLLLLLTVPAYREYWDTESFVYSREFQSEVKSILEELKSAPVSKSLIIKLQESE